MLLSVTGVRKLFADEIVLDGVGFRLDRREKVALVGRNGTGKTTLLKILTGQMEPDSGNVQWERGSSWGYLSQASLPDSDATVLEVATQAREHLVQMQERLRELEEAMAHGATAEDLDEYSLLQEHFNAQGGYSVENDLKVVLKRLGFEEDEWTKPVRALSGGERTRLALAKLLLEEPDLLILDEPTNHLDLEAIDWLESWIRGYGGAVLLVSHDRTFLQNVSQRILELREHVITSFPGPFEKYLELRKAEDQRLADLAEKQAEEMAKLDEFVRRFMNSQRTAQARGRLKMLERMEAQRVIPPKAEKGMKGGFQVLKRAGDLVLDCKKLTMAFGEQRLFRDLDWTVRWGERWGIIGANGAGKSTLMKVALGELEAVSGTAKLGSNVDLGWFRQDAAFLDLNQTPLEVMHYELGMDQAQARSLLGRFLITGDDVFRPIRTLSGGERVKVALAAITAMHPNVLILDEPTNHLDIASREALAEVLAEYNGTLIVVSHDRWFLNQVTTQTLDLQPNRVVQFPGPYAEYRSAKQAGGNTSAKSAPQTKPTSVASSNAPSNLNIPVMSPRELSKEIGRLTKEVEKLEDQISKEESELEALERVMARPQEGMDLVAMSLKHTELRARIDGLLAEWTDHGTRLEDLRRLQGNGEAIGITFRNSD